MIAGRRSCALVALTALLTLVSLGGPTTGSRADGGHGPEQVRPWSSSITTVCVESRVGREWDVKGAIRRWNRLEGGPTLVLQASCPDYEGSVTVRYRGADNEFTGWTDWYWNADGDIVHAEVTVNPRRLTAFARKDLGCVRRYTTGHELGHALGLEHYPHAHAGAVMSYLGWRGSCGRLNDHDRADFSALYPAAALRAGG